MGVPVRDRGPGHSDPVMFVFACDFPDSRVHGSHVSKRDSTRKCTCSRESTPESGMIRFAASQIGFDGYSKAAKTRRFRIKRTGRETPPKRVKRP